MAHLRLASSPLEIIRREDELQKVFVWFGQAQNGSGSVLEIWGVPGIGKTSLLDQICDDLNEKKVHFARIDFRYHPPEDYKSRPSSLFHDLLPLFNGNPPDYLNQKIQSIDLADPSEKDARLEQTIQAFTQACCEQAPKGKSVIMLDETDRMNRDQMTWIENQIIIPLIKDGHCLVIWIGRKRKFWRDPIVRMQKQSILLEPFTLTQMEKYYPELMVLAHDKPEWIAFAREATRGHPLANALLKSFIARYDLSVVSLNDIKIQLLEYIKEEALQQYILLETSPDWKEIWPLLMIVRTMETNTLKHLFSVWMRAKGPMPDVANLLKDLREDRLALSETDGQRGTTRIERSISSLFITCLRTLEPDVYLKAHQTAFEVFKELVNLHHQTYAPDGWPLLVPEMLYHGAQICSINPGTIDLADELTASIKLFQARVTSDDFYRYCCNQLYQRVEGDNELCNIIDDATVDRLRDALNTFCA